VVALGALAWGTASRPARACSGPYAYVCSGAGAVAAPENAQMFVFRGAYEASGAAGSGLRRSTRRPVLHLTDARGADVAFSLNADENLAGYWLVRPTVTLAAGEKYTLRWEAVCSPAEIATSLAPDRDKAAGAEVTLIVPAPAPPPALGTLQLAGPLRRANARCSCGPLGPFDEVGVRATLDSGAAASLAPYAGMATTVAIVDGVAIDEAPWARRATGCEGEGILNASCTPGVDTGIAPGVHRVGLRVTVAGTSAPLVAEQNVHLDCAAPPSAAADAGALPDGGRDSAVDASDAGAAGASSASSCAIGAEPPTRSSASPWWLCVGLSASLLALRRRVPRSS